jgi:preprotein translocase subunit SecG
MQTILLIIHLITCLLLIGLVLLQHGKGADAGVLTGGGGANSFFGSKGASSFLLKITTALAIVFFSTCMSLDYLSNKTHHQSIVSKTISHAKKPIKY